MTESKQAAQPREITSIQQWLIERGHHPDDVVNGESLLDLLWAFWVFKEDERAEKRERTR